MADVEGARLNRVNLGVSMGICIGAPNGSPLVVESAKGRPYGEFSVRITSEGLIFNCNKLENGQCNVIENRNKPDCPAAKNSGSIVANGTERLADQKIISIETPRFVLTLDRGAREVTKGGDVVDLTPTEFTLLDTLMSNPGIYVSSSQIMDTLHPEGWYNKNSSMVNTYIGYLRRKIDGPGRTVETSFIQTKIHFGYRIPRLKPPKGS